MNNPKLLQAAILSLMAFCLSSFSHTPISGSRNIASCQGESAAIPPSAPFGTDLYAKLNAAAFKESQAYWSNYLTQVQNDAAASRMAIRNSYGLSLPPNPGLASAAGIIPTSFSASSPAFAAFTPLAIYNSTASLGLPMMASGIGFGMGSSFNTSFRF